VSKYSKALEMYDKENRILSLEQVGLGNVEVHDAKTEDSTPSSQLSTNPEEQIAANESETVSSDASMNNIDKNLITINKPNSMEAELFRVLRGKILFPVSGKPPRSILITSAVPGEGKSYITSNIAVHMAQYIDKTVLLMDCDLRRPTIHKIFGFNHVNGLSEYLTNHTKLSNVLLKTMVDELTLLPAGKPPDNPSEILSSSKMVYLIDELKSRYDDRFLIIDSPPTLLAPETHAIAKQVDGVILVIKADSTPIDLIDEMINSMGKDKIIGAVINQYDMPSPKYYRYKKYSKYYENHADGANIQSLKSRVIQKYLKSKISQDQRKQDALNTDSQSDKLLNSKPKNSESDQPN
jgi:protein-tyrosine kinase